MLLKGKGLGGCGGGGRAASIPLQRGGGGVTITQREGSVRHGSGRLGHHSRVAASWGRGWGMSRGAVTGR